MDVFTLYQAIVDIVVMHKVLIQVHVYVLAVSFA